MYAQTLSFLLTISVLTHPSTSVVDTFIYGACSQLRYTAGTQYASNVNSILTSLVNSAAVSTYNNFKISLPGTPQSEVVYGLFQCRGDLSHSDCRDCVSHSVSRLGVICPGSTGASVQLDGCFVKYDNVTFLGVEDKTVVYKKCGPSIGYESDVLTRRDAVLGYLTGEGQYFRVGGSGNVQGVAQCVQDLNISECADCLTEATGQLRNECSSAAWGDMFLAKCYVRYTDHGHHFRRDSDQENEETQKTLAILIGIVTGVTLVIVLLSGLSKICDDDEKDGK